VNYFLSKFKKVEWSGPAWYSYTVNKDGNLEDFTLEYFHPLHLGNAASTDWEGKELIKIYKDLTHKYPKIGKTWIQGNIHSHHSMGAFFSGTDEQQLEDGANENIYASLVVSTKIGKELAFSISYPDQWGLIRILEIESIEVLSEVVHNKKWEEQAAYITKLKKEEPVKTYTHWNSQYKQTSMFSEPDLHKDEDVRNSQLFYANMVEMDEEIFAKFDDIWMKYEKGTLSESNRDQLFTNLGVDKYGSDILDIDSYC